MITSKEKVIVRERARDCCEYCLAQAKFSHDPFSVEHIIPLAKGGNDDLENLAWSCLGCNNYKFTAIEAPDMVTGFWVKIFSPRKDVWVEHFSWSEDFSQMIGLTPTGRATINRLQLNRPGLVNLRTILTSAGYHPMAENE